MSSKAAPRFQSLRFFQDRTTGRRAATVAGVVGLMLMCPAANIMPDGRPTPSTQPVPRWLSLNTRVHARQGPGTDYRVLWTYQARNLPVQVIAETRDWRKICDPDGAVAWVHRTVVSGRRNAFNPSTREVSLHASRSETSPVRARLAPRSIVPLSGCEDGWCRIGPRKRQGWARQDAIVGARPDAMCDASRPAGPAPAATNRG